MWNINFAFTRLVKVIACKFQDKAKGNNQSARQHHYQRFIHFNLRIALV